MEHLPSQSQRQVLGWMDHSKSLLNLSIKALKRLQRWQRGACVPTCTCLPYRVTCGDGRLHPWKPLNPDDLLSSMTISWKQGPHHWLGLYEDHPRRTRTWYIMGPNSCAQGKVNIPPPCLPHLCPACPSQNSDHQGALSITEHQRIWRVAWHEALKATFSSASQAFLPFFPMLLRCLSTISWGSCPPSGSQAPMPILLPPGTDLDKVAKPHTAAVPFFFPPWACCWQGQISLSLCSS